MLTGSYYYENFVASNRTESRISETQADAAYTLREYNGFLALFTDGNSLPDAVYSVPIDSLPEADRKSLADGINVNNTQELQRLLEDFTG